MARHAWVDVLRKAQLWLCNEYEDCLFILIFFFPNKYYLKDKE